ncbi:MAG TPA: HipA N-terminal domain-containing protein [Ignavibacteriaceae bacterium]|nr:HipA N-terminal domain-containing protein [Ignavibacteriaceae bacterium]
MRKAEVYRNGILAGILEEKDNGEFIFTYNTLYFNDETKPGISLTLPKKQLVYTSKHLFPFFFNMLSEGTNRVVQSKQLKIDENDFFGLLLATAQYDTIGAVTVKEIN